MKEKKAVFRFDQDSKRYHRFLIEDHDEEIVGTVYVRKDAEVPERIVLENARTAEDN